LAPKAVQVTQAPLLTAAGGQIPPIRIAALGRGLTQETDPQTQGLDLGAQAFLLALQVGLR
jgi:hypothetical protein